MNNTVEQRILSAVAEQLSRPVHELPLDATFEAVGADSLDRVEIVMKVEELFDIELDDEVLETVPTLHAFIEYVAQVVVHSSGQSAHE